MTSLKQIFEAKIGLAEDSASKQQNYTDYNQWKKDLPRKSKIFVDGQVERARTTGEAIDSVVGQFDKSKKSGWIYNIYLNK